MLLAAQMTFGWLRQQKQQPVPNYEPDDGPLTDEQIEQLKEMSKPPAEETTSEFDVSKHAYLHEPFSHFKDLKPMVYKPEVEKKEDDFEFLAKYEEITPAPILETVTADTTDVKVDEPTYQILPELDEESKKKSYMIKQGEQQIVKTKN